MEAETALKAIGVVIPFGGLIWYAGRNIVTKNHLYEKNGTPIYQKAKGCSEIREKETREQASDYANVVTSIDGLGNTVQDLAALVAKMDKNQAVLANEVKHLNQHIRKGG